MHTQNLLQLKAINAAKKSDWQGAIDHNTELIELYPDDIGALNRLGVAYLQLGKLKEAKQTFSTVLEVDSSNKIAKKHLEAIAQKRASKAPTFSKEQFIEEPGTTKIIELHRLANKQVLDNLSVGQTCDFKLKGRYISVETENDYVGALPEDLSFRLTKLIKRGNSYSCYIYGTSGKTCSVYIKEIGRSKRNANINSFPLSKAALTAINDVDERFLLEDNIPVSIVNTDSDEEKTLDDVDTSSED